VRREVPKKRRSKKLEAVLKFRLWAHSGRISTRGRGGIDPRPASLELVRAVPPAVETASTAVGCCDHHPRAFSFLSKRPTIAIRASGNGSCTTCLK